MNDALNRQKYSGFIIHVAAQRIGYYYTPVTSPVAHAHRIKNSTR
jgi:hypothetical protein